MSPTPHAVAVQRGRVASLTRSRTPDDPEFVAARQELKTLVLSAKVSAALHSDPPLNETHIARIAALLTPTAPSTTPRTRTRKASTATKAGHL